MYVTIFNRRFSTTLVTLSHFALFFLWETRASWEGGGKILSLEFGEQWGDLIIDKRPTCDVKSTQIPRTFKEGLNLDLITQCQELMVIVDRSLCDQEWISICINKPWLEIWLQKQSKGPVYVRRKDASEREISKVNTITTTLADLLGLCNLIQRERSLSEAPDDLT